MAIAAQAFSPKDWKVGILNEATAGTSVLTALADFLQLDVDSIGFPSLNVTQKLDVKSGAGRTLKDEDFFQDNIMRVAEFSLSGTLHNDAAHLLLVKNICNDITNEIAVASGFTPVSQIYGSAATNSASSLTVIFQPSSVTNQQAMEFEGCIVTSFSITADANSDGGQYKWSATFQTGRKPDLASVVVPNAITAYANTTIPLLSSSSAHEVFDVPVVMSSFTATIESPGVFTGMSTNGYQVASRGAECSVTAETQVKYDANTKGFINSFDTQTAAFNGASMFKIVNDAAFGVDIKNGVFTNVALSEGDIMMLDCSIKAVDDGTDDLISIDIA